METTTVEPLTTGGPLAVWWDGAADGATNMAADECLAGEAERCGSLLVRVYGWTRTTVSLGAFQRLDDARRGGELAHIPVVRRPSGGGAIVHGSDLTYAAAVPKSHPFGASPQVFYDALHAAMADVVTGLGVPVRPHAGDEEHAPVAAAADPFFCFDRRSRGDLVAAAGAPAGSRPPKLMGSAQRRLAGVVLQHGSLLLRPNPDVAGPARHLALADMCVAPLPPAAEIARAWTRRVAAVLGGTPVDRGSFLAEYAVAIEARAARFRDDRWTGRR